MKNIFLSRILGLIFLLAASSSCTSNLDFNQAKTLVAKPVVVANLASFEITAAQLTSDGTYPLRTSVDFDVFRDTFFQKNLIKAVFDFEIDNATSRSYILNIELQDRSGAHLYDFTIDVPANTTSPIVPKKHQEIFENAGLNSLKSTEKIVFRITKGLSTGTTINPGSLKLRSSATAYLVIQ